MLRVLSLGAGVQSSTLALMCAKGEYPAPDFAVFADTQAEPRSVYDWLDWLERQLPFEVVRVTEGVGLEAHMLAALRGERFAGVPFYTESDNVRGGTLKRQCTSEFKLGPMNRYLRQRLGLAKGQRSNGPVVERWIGISRDEAHRMKPSREAWAVHKWPLVDMGMSRWDCLAWMERNGYPRPPKSACVFCPYHDDALWRDMRDNDPESWQRAVAMDRACRNGVRGTTQKLYLHRSLRPLEEVDLSTAEDRGQYRLFGAECEGMCGV